nr:glucosamine 6-phosphate N-acetyltransferase isoform X1 [Ziziphus jujuba var. spinosa]
MVVRHGGVSLLRAIRIPHATPDCFIKSISVPRSCSVSLQSTIVSSIKLGFGGWLSILMCSNPSTEGPKLQVRRLEISDKSSFIELLQQLTVCDSVSDKEFEDRFQELSILGDDHVICVIEDDRSGKIIATGSVFIEKKFIRNCGKVGHIEDVVVDSNARGMQLGKKIIGFLTDHARSMGCYKVILDCSTDNKTFYEKCGFKQKEIQMVMYFT